MRCHIFYEVESVNQRKVLTTLGVSWAKMSGKLLPERKINAAGDTRAATLWNPSADFLCFAFEFEFKKRYMYHRHA